MPDQDIFNADKQTQQAQQGASLVEALVGEGKKYPTVEELAKGYYNADNFLETLKDENRTLREQVAKVSDLEAVIEQLKAKSGSGTSDNSAEVGGGKANLDAADVAKLVEQALVKVEDARAKASNLKVADSKLKEVFGDEAQKVFDEVASTPAMRESLTTLAKQSPDEFVKFLVTLKGKSDHQPQSVGFGGESKTNTVQVGSSFGTRVADPECKEYYTELRRKDPSKYYSQDVQIKMNNAAIKNATKFFGATK